MRHIVTIAHQAFTPITYDLRCLKQRLPNRSLQMEDLQRLLLLRLLVVLGPGVMLLWLYFGLTPPQPLPPWSIALFLGLMALSFIALRLRVRFLKPVVAWEVLVQSDYSPTC
jgi:hypothetical protein